MKTVTTRRLALLGATTTTAVLAGLLVAPSATAAITQISPPSTVNSEASRQVTLTTSGSDTDYRFGGSLTLTHGGATAATYTVTIQPSPTAQRTPSATLTPSDTGNGLGQDGPLDAGDYRVTATASGAPLTGTGAGTDSCAGGTTATCFTVQAALPAQPVLVSTVEPGAARAGDSADVTLTGDNFERRSRIEVLLPDGSGPDPLINLNQPPVGEGSTTDADSTQGITTRSTLERRVTVGANALTGARDVRVTNLDGRTGVCSRCFSVNGAPLTGVSTSAGDNDPSLPVRSVTFSGTGLNPSGRPTLVYTADPGSSTRDALTLPGSNVRGVSSTSITADFDLRDAAPGLYTPAVRNPDGSTNACDCRFQVTQNQNSPSRATTVTSVDSATATAGTQKTQQAGTTQAFVVNGTGFSRGTRVTVSGTGVTTTAVEFLSATALRATFQSTSAAAPGDRNVTATRTDGVTSPPCNACYTVTAAASASPSATPTSTTSPRPSSSPSASPSAGTVEPPSVSVSPASITAGQRAVVSGTGTPGSTIEIHAYSRPRVEYQVVRRATVGDDGRYSFDVGPSGNTRLFARTVRGSESADSPSTVLTVRTSINLRVTRTGTRTYRFTGSTLPKRAGQTVNVRYRSGSGTVVASKARVAANGTYNVTRRFSGTGTFTFFTDTGRDINNAAGLSNAVRVTVR